MKPIPLVLLFLFSFTFFHALPGQSDYQQTVIPGAKWTIRKGQGMGSFGYSEMAISCDTLRANEKEYLAVQLLSDVNGATCALGYVREDTIEQKLYFIPEEDENQQEILIVDYSLEKGDTFVNYRGIEYIVDTVREIDFFGQPTKFIDFGLMASDGFIVGFGSYMSGPVLNCEGFTNIDDYEVSETACSQLTGSEESIFKRAIRISPNPAYDQLSIELGASGESAFMLRIFSAQGYQLMQTRLNRGGNSIELNHLPKGLLFLEFSNASDRFTHRLIYH